MKAASTSLSAVLLASLLAIVTVPVASASTTVTSAGSVPVGGTSVAPASFQFCENAAGDWHSGGTISVTITDANGASTLSFTDASGGVAAPSLSAPGSLGASVASVTGGTVTVNLTTDDVLNVGCFTIGTLYITAAGSAAAGAINATSGGTISTATYGPMTTSATGLLAASAAPGATSVPVVLTSACPFVNVGSGPGPASDFTIAGNDGGAAGTASALAAGQQTLSGFAALLVAVPAGGAVTQANVPSCSTAMSLPAPGIVGVLQPPIAPTIATGYGHTCALVMGGSVDCWGDNSDLGARQWNV